MARLNETYPHIRRQTTMRTWQTLRISSLDRHSHREPYAALILSGSYEEAGDRGRLHVQAGQVVFHDRFEAHLDRFSESGAIILNLRLPKSCSCNPGIAKVDDPDFIVRTAQRSREDGAKLVISLATSVYQPFWDWPDELAAALIEDPSLKLSQWREEMRLTPWGVSRGFVQVFGITPEVFRARARARQAWKSIRGTEEPLARIAAHWGFADQSHMTRDVKLLTGATPGAWRTAANGFKTGTRPAF